MEVKGKLYALAALFPAEESLTPTNRLTRRLVGHRTGPNAFKWR